MKTSDLFIDSLEFARREREASGRVPVSMLTRLADQLADTEGELEWSLTGEQSVDRFGQPQCYLRLRVCGDVNLVCQRCLSAMKQPLDIEARLLLVAPGMPWPEEGLENDPGEGGEAGEGHVSLDDADPVEALTEQRVLDLVEDELLLALPIVPRHPVCALPEHDDGRAAASPFAALAQLKRTH